MFTKRNLYVHILKILDTWYVIVKLRTYTTPRFVTVDDVGMTPPPPPQ